MAETWKSILDHHANSSQLYAVIAHTERFVSRKEVERDRDIAVVRIQTAIDTFLNALDQDGLTCHSKLDVGMLKRLLDYLEGYQNKIKKKSMYVFTICSSITFFDSLTT